MPRRVLARQVAASLPAWSGPYWDARVLDEVCRAWAQGLIETGWAVSTALYRAYRGE